MGSLLVTQQESVRTLTLNRPERRNALNPELQQTFVDALHDAARDSACRVVILTGAGNVFCAGLDLARLQGMHDRSEAEHVEDAGRVSGMFRALYDFPKPTIAAVHGPALAGGTGLATLCDFTLATSAAKFGYTEARIGFVPALVSAYLVLQIGEKRARELLLTGRLFSAEEAYRLGLVTEIVAAEVLMERANALAQALVANSPESMRATKALLAAQSKPWLEAALEASLRANAEARRTHDFREGVAAFLEKRKPSWKSDVGTD